MTLNPDAPITYSPTDGFTVVGGATAEGVSIAHYPTKAEPWTDVFAMLRTLGEVVISTGSIERDDPIETDTEAYEGELAEVCRQRDEARAEVDRLTRNGTVPQSWFDKVANERDVALTALDEAREGRRRAIDERDETERQLQAKVSELIGTIDERDEARAQYSRLNRELDDAKAALAETKQEDVF